jgi:hypothetical protein
MAIFGTHSATLRAGFEVVLLLQSPSDEFFRSLNSPYLSN